MHTDSDIIIINKVVFFSPIKNMLYPADREQDAISLNVPVSRCLALLLEHAGQVVSRQTFYTEVWEKQGLYVTDNTFYQNISILRKTLRAVGIRENVIQTVPREGIRFTGMAEKSTINLEIKPLDDTNKVERNMSPLSPEDINPRLSYLKLTHRLKFAISIFLVILASCFLLYSIPVQHDVFNSFSTVNLGSCQVHFHGAIQKEEIVNLLTRNSIECKNNNEIFITVNENRTRTAYTVCDTYTKKNQICRSYLYISEEP